MLLAGVMASQYPMFALCLLVAGLVGPSTSSDCVRISGAYYDSYNSEMFFVIGQEVYVLDSDNNLANILPVHDLNFDHPVTAALGGYNEYYLYSGVIEQGYGDFGEKNNFVLASYAAVHALDNIDAAVESAGEYVFFDGCDHVTVSQDTLWIASAKQPNSDLDLPCDLDAAFYSPLQGVPVAVKGNQAWIYNESVAKFRGPVDIKDVLWGIDYLPFCSNE